MNTKKLGYLTSNLVCEFSTLNQFKTVDRKIDQNAITTNVYKCFLFIHINRRCRNRLDVNKSTGNMQRKNSMIYI